MAEARARLPLSVATRDGRTTEAADRMYDVTMQEEGVSRLVGVRFDEVLGEAA